MNEIKNSVNNEYDINNIEFNKTSIKKRNIFEKINKLYISQRNKNDFPKNSLQKPLKSIEPIKVILTPICQRGSKVKNMINKEINNSNSLMMKDNKLSNSIYLTPSRTNNFDNNNNTISQINDNKLNYNLSKSSFKMKTYSNCNTPYKRINVKSKREAISPSVIIKNFNYNNVYNINFDNDKLKTPKNERNDNKNRFSQNFTYNKPKTTSNINIPYSMTRDKSQDKFNTHYESNSMSNYNINKNETFYSRFFSEGNCLKNTKDNFIINSSFLSDDSKPIIINNKIN